MIPQNQKITAPSDVLSPVAKAAAIEALDWLQTPEAADLAWTAARMEPQHVIAGCFRVVGKLATGEADPDEVRGMLLTAVCWISAAGESQQQQH
ncbi:MAG TPA: hypothetical protein PKY50_19270 [Candidatus Competibacter sp.]|nr:hypothetical protein [Candidatus Competibacter sp.]